MTAFGFLTLAVFVVAMAIGLSAGIFAFAVNDPMLAWLSGGLAFAPIFLVVGRVWAKADMRHAADTAGKSEG